MRILATVLHRFCVALFCLCALSSGITAQESSETIPTGDILMGAKLSKGLNLGVDSSKKERKWLTTEKAKSYFVMAFLPDQEWSAAFVTVGSSSNTMADRRYRDYSAFKTLTVEMKGSVGGEKIEIGIKSKDQADDGTETKVPVMLTPEWRTYEFSLDDFKGANLKELYVLAEFVYTCGKPQTVNLRSIKYVREQAIKPETGGSPCESSEAEAMEVMVGTKLAGGFGLGVNSSGGLRDWVSKKEGEFMILSFPANEDWAAAFVTVGPPNQRLKDGRQSKDLSAFDSLLVDLKGAVGREVVDIGIKTNAQEDDGTETKIPVTLSQEWKTYQFDLARFVGTSPRRLYVVAEFVYEGSKPQTVFLRNIRYMRATAKANRN